MIINNHGSALLSPRALRFIWGGLALAEDPVDDAAPPRPNLPLTNHRVGLDSRDCQATRSCDWKALYVTAGASRDAVAAVPLAHDEAEEMTDNWEGCCTMVAGGGGACGEVP